MIEGQSSSSSSSNQPLPLVEDRDMSEPREKRASKPREIYDPSNVPAADGRGRKKMNNRQKNVASDGHDHNKWSQYGQRIKSNLARLRRENHFVEVLTLQKRDSRSSSSNGGNILLDEVTRCLERITNAKLGITHPFISFRTPFNRPPPLPTAPSNAPSHTPLTPSFPPPSRSPSTSHFIRISRIGRGEQYRSGMGRAGRRGQRGEWNYT